MDRFVSNKDYEVQQWQNSREQNRTQPDWTDIDSNRKINAERTNNRKSGFLSQYSGNRYSPQQKLCANPPCWQANMMRGYNQPVGRVVYDRLPAKIQSLNNSAESRRSYNQQKVISEVGITKVISNEITRSTDAKNSQERRKL